MPSIETAMRRSMRRGVADIVFNSLQRRDIVGEVSSVKNSFSSWSNCMQATYCKWPVIVMIIIGGLIVFSILWCIIRCACCGMSCCCSCFSFLKCCDCCGDSCAGKKDKPMKHLDDPFSQPGPRQGYQAPAPMMGGALGGKPDLPQYAQFEVGKNGLFVEPKATALSEDALPPMPSWDTAAKKHVLTEEEKNAVELGELDPVTGQKIPLMTGAAAAGNSVPPSPHDPSPFGPRPGQGVGGNGYMGVPGDRDQYAQNQNASNQNGYNVPGAYDRTPSPGQGGQPRFGSPGPGMNGQGRGYGAQNSQGRGGYGPPSPQNGQGRGGYGPPSPQDPYAQESGFVGAAVGGDGYGRTQPQRQYSNDGRPFPQPARQYSSDSSRPLNPGRGYSDRSDRPYPSDNFQPQGPPRGPSRGPVGPNRMASPPLNNNSGFDFGTGTPQQQYSSRPSPPPQQMSYDSSNNGRRPSQPSQRGGNGNGNGGYYNGGSTAPPSYASRSPPPQDTAAYPGYQAYQPASSQGGRGGGRGGREPQGWDPVRQQPS